MSIRLLHIIANLNRGGAQEQMAMLTASLPRDQFDTHICAFNADGPFLSDLHSNHVPVRALRAKRKFDLHVPTRLFHYIRELRPDIVHTWTDEDTIVGRLAALAAGVKRIVDRARCPERSVGWSRFAVDQYLAHRTQRTVVSGNRRREQMLAEGWPGQRVVVIPPAVRPTPADNSTSRKELLCELGMPSNAWTIGCVGHLRPHNRIKDVIWTADLLKVVHDNVHIVIIGDGPQRRKLERFRDQVLIRDRVHFLGRRDDVLRLVPHLHCLWFTGDRPDDSNVIMEAMMAGIPVIGTNIPANVDLIVPDVNGCLYPVGNRAALARQTHQLLNDPQMCHRLGNAGRQRMIQEFSVKSMAEGYTRLYRQLLQTEVPHRVD